MNNLAEVIQDQREEFDANNVPLWLVTFRVLGKWYTLHFTNEEAARAQKRDRVIYLPPNGGDLE